MPKSKNDGFVVDVLTQNIPENLLTRYEEMEAVHYPVIDQKHRTT